MFTKEVFDVIPQGTPILVNTQNFVAEGYYSGTAIWEDMNEKEQFEGFTVEEVTGYLHWIPWEVVRSVEFFNA